LSAAGTQDMVIHGTPAFMAPEQALGSANVDGRADIYATGCVAYWLLTGQHVFTADTPMAILLHHAQTPATPPSARTEVPIPSALDDLVLSCLAKDPAARPQTARELSRRLASVKGANDWTDDRARGLVGQPLAGRGRARTPRTALCSPLVCPAADREEISLRIDEEPAAGEVLDRAVLQPLLRDVMEHLRLALPRHEMPSATDFEQQLVGPRKGVVQQR
jgi:hypothetical protein